MTAWLRGTNCTWFRGPYLYGHSDPWIQNYAGDRIPVLDIRPEHFHVDSIAYQAAHINRWTGCAGTYSVAQHEVHAYEMAPIELKPYCLLHDTLETVLNDVATPVKLCLPEYVRMEHRGELALWRAFNLPAPTDAQWQEVKEIDGRLMSTEYRDLIPVHRDDFKRPPPYEHMTIVRWDPDFARRRWLDAYYEVLG